jgi:hypothetical protein
MSRRAVHFINPLSVSQHVSKVVLFRGSRERDSKSLARMPRPSIGSWTTTSSPPAVGKVRDVIGRIPVLSSLKVRFHYRKKRGVA